MNTQPHIVEFAVAPAHVPWMLAVIVLAAAGVAWGLSLMERRRKRRILRLAEPHLASRLIIGLKDTQRGPLIWLPAVGVLCLGLALMQPHWGQSPRAVEGFSRDIIVCVDTSDSMLANDMPPSRLSRARQKIAAIIEQAPGDRFGLVAFAGGAALQCPPTSDHAYFLAVLDAIDTDTISLKGTDIGGAIKQAIAAFMNADGRAMGSEGARAIILVSDGETSSRDVTETAREAARIAPVLVLGIGDPEGALVEQPVAAVSRRGQSRAAETHISKPDREMLAGIASAGEGFYVHARPDGRDVQQIVQHLQSIAARSVRSDFRTSRLNRFQWPLALAAMCFAGEGAWLAIVPWFRRRTGAAQGKEASDA